MQGAEIFAQAVAAEARAAAKAALVRPASKSSSTVAAKVPTRSQEVRPGSDHAASRGRLLKAVEKTAEPTPSVAAERPQSATVLTFSPSNNCDEAPLILKRSKGPIARTLNLKDSKESGTAQSNLLAPHVRPLQAEVQF